MAIVDRFHTLKARAVRKLARLSFHFLERHLDLHVTVNDYYSPIPSVKDLSDADYERPFSMTGVNMDDAGQLNLLDSIMAHYTHEFVPEPNDGLSLADAFALYAMIRHHKPRRMVEIGGGNSTLIAMKAVLRNREEGHPCHFVCVEPYPRPFLRDAQWNDYELVTEVVQKVPISAFADADIVFIDSSHVSKIGSDVNYEMLEIVPNTKVGCLIHWHDIVLPTNYWKDWTTLSGQFWNESYLLHAFLMFNDCFSVRWAARHMHRLYPDRLKARFSYLTEHHRLTSFWVQRVR